MDENFEVAFKKTDAYALLRHRIVSLGGVEGEVFRNDGITYLFNKVNDYLIIWNEATKK